MLILIVFVLKKKAVFSNYKLIQTDFIEWSNKRRVNYNKPNGEIIIIAKRLIIPLIALISSISLGPLAGAIIATEKSSLGDRSNFFLLWPQVSLNF